MVDIKKQLFTLQDTKYKDFQSRLLPTVNPQTIIGVRTPDMRKLAKKLAKESDINLFLQKLPHEYYEENCVHAFILETIRDYEKCMLEVERFLPYIDNWATCDQLSPGVFSKNREKLLEKIKEWLRSEHTYTIRFGVDMLMKWFLDEDFSEDCLKLAADIRSEEYYVKMVVAWYFATALAKQYDAALPYLQERRLEEWTHNKAIQKATESRRISEAQKEYLRSLKIR